VVTFADFTDDDGMKRYEATKEGEKLTKLETEDSGDEATLKAQLEWTRDNYKAKRYAVIFLDHGGALSEMSNDSGPGKSKREWLHAVKVADVLSAWRKTLPGKLELVFLQQCGKGALENYHAFRSTAPVVMASQTVVGAPNYYYTDMVKDTCAKPDIDGKTLAELIRKHETDNMFTTYTAVGEAALGKLAEKLEVVLKPLLAVKELKKPTIIGQYSRSRGEGVRTCFDMPGEKFVDGLALLKALYDANELEHKPLEEFSKWVKEELITGHRVSPRRERVAGTWCGFSIMVPHSKKVLEGYRNYPIYKETQLDELMLKLIE
jgi:hypothetical protein